MMILVSVLAVGCQAPYGKKPAPMPVGETPRDPRIVGWRLVERTFEESHPRRGVVGAGFIPADERRLVYEPVYEKPRESWLMGGTLRVESRCDHEIVAHIKGSRTRNLGEKAVIECWLDTPPGIYHEIAISGTAPAVEILGVEGIPAARGGPGRYLAGSERFRVIFTSKQVGNHGVLVSILREIGNVDPRQELIQAGAR